MDYVLGACERTPETVAVAFIVMCIIALRNVYNRRLSPKTNLLLLVLFFVFFCGWPFILYAFRAPELFLKRKHDPHI